METTATTKMTATQKRVASRESQIEFIKKSARTSEVEVEIYKNLVIVSFTSKVRNEDRPQLNMWRGTQENPFSRYYYRKLEDREFAINEAKKNADWHQEYDEKKKAERKNHKHDLAVGDILSASWGYEQTNIDFYQVIELFGKTGVVIQELCQEHLESTGMDQGTVGALKGQFKKDSEPMRKYVNTSNSVKIESYAYASKSSGKEWSSWYY